MASAIAKGVKWNSGLTSVNSNFFWFVSLNYSVVLSFFFTEILREAVSICCYGCTRIIYLPPYQSAADMFYVDPNSSATIVMPFMSKKDAKSYFGSHYFRLMATPGVVYITKNTDKEKYQKDFAESLIGTWPLILITFLMAVQAGVIIWVLVSISLFTNPLFQPLLQRTKFKWLFVNMKNLRVSAMCAIKGLCDIMSCTNHGVVKSSQRASKNTE